MNSLKVGALIVLGSVLSSGGAAQAGFSVVGPPPSAQNNVQTRQPQHPQQPQVAPEADDPAVRELLEQRRKQQEAYGALNQMNPMSQDFDPSAKPAGTGPMAEVQKLLQNPAARATLNLASSPVVSEAYRAIVSHPNRMILLYSEIGLFVVMLIFRAWRRSKATHWARKLWVSFYSFAGMVVIGAMVLPALIIGPAFVNALRAVIGS